MTPKMLIADLVGQVQEIARAAQDGDEDSRRWLCDAFPSHVNFFVECWPETRPPTPPSKAIIETLRRGAANEQSRRLVERLERGKGGK